MVLLALLGTLGVLYGFPSSLVLGEDHNDRHKNSVASERRWVGTGGLYGGTASPTCSCVGYSSKGGRDVSDEGTGDRNPERASDVRASAKPSTRVRQRREMADRDISHDL